MTHVRTVHRHWRTILTVCFSSFLLPASLYGEAWSQTAGPPGGEITAFASSGSFAFAGTRSGGLYRSINGQTWSSLRNELCSTCTITDLAVIDGHVFAATETDGIFRSVNDGGTWEPMNAGLPGLQVLQLIVQAPDLWALIGAEFGGGDLYHSTNLGASWQLTGSPTAFTRIVALPSVILGNTTFGGMLRSTDGGQTWDFPAGEGLIGTTGPLTTFAVKGSTLFAASDSTNTVFKTTDAGDNWTQINIAIPPRSESA